MLGASILLSSVLTLLIPMATFHTVWALVGIRVVEGLVQVTHIHTHTYTYPHTHTYIHTHTHVHRVKVLVEAIMHCCLPSCSFSESTIVKHSFQSASCCSKCMCMGLYRELHYCKTIMM